MAQLKIIVEKHPDGYVAYPLGCGGGVVGQGTTYEAALSDVQSAMRSQADHFGEEEAQAAPTIVEAFVTETGVKVWW